MNLNSSHPFVSSTSWSVWAREKDLVDTPPYLSLCSPCTFSMWVVFWATTTFKSHSRHMAFCMCMIANRVSTFVLMKAFRLENRWRHFCFMGLCAGLTANLWVMIEQSILGMSSEPRRTHWCIFRVPQLFQYIGR